MTIPTEITFRDIEPSDALRTLVRERVQRLERFARDIRTCHVTIGLAEAHHIHGNAISVHATLTLRGRQLDVQGSSKNKPTKEDAYAMVDVTMNVLRRRVEDYVRKRRDHRERAEPIS